MSSTYVQDTVFEPYADALHQYSFANLTTQKDIDRITSFFESKDCSKFEMSLKQTVDNIRASMSWLQRSKKDVASWLKTHVPS
jgi:aminopeptidase 2